jgi:hypothetical protein
LTFPTLALTEQMQPADMTPLYRSPNGDSWFLARDPATGLAVVRHQANAPSGGRVTDIEVGAFPAVREIPNTKRSCV